jgi:hypothetical protein
VTAPVSPSIFVHTCTLQHTISTGKDQYGAPSPNKQITASVCRFFTCQVVGENAAGVPIFIDQLHCILPGASVAQDEDTIISTVPGYNGTFQVINAEPDTNRAGVRHWTCTIKKVV